MSPYTKLLILFAGSVVVTTLVYEVRRKAKEEA
jgi:hypothetical protein